MTDQVSSLIGSWSPSRRAHREEVDIAHSELEAGLAAVEMVEMVKSPLAIMCEGKELDRLAEDAATQGPAPVRTLTTGRQ